jgi:hypothetical protein
MLSRLKATVEATPPQPGAVYVAVTGVPTLPEARLSTTVAAPAAWTAMTAMRGTSKPVEATTDLTLRAVIRFTRSPYK